jgi:hypothetical protein
VSDLERLFRLLVSTVAALDPARLHRPLSLEEIRQSVLPYRTVRRALGLESSEDYEFLLLRLCAGDGGFARTDPRETQERFAAQLASPNPDLSLLRQHGDALVTLAGVQVARALMAEPHDAYAPPGASPARETSGGPPAAPPRGSPDSAPLDDLLDAPEPPPAHEIGAAETLMCLCCGGSLPPGRPVNFCPHCGHPQTSLRCPACQSDVEPGWRHCASCGTLLGEP